MAKITDLSIWKSDDFKSASPTQLSFKLDLACYFRQRS